MLTTYKSKLDIDLLTKCFYSMMALEEQLSGAKLEALKKYEKSYQRKFAQALFDYIVLASAGELRHSLTETKRKHLNTPLAGLITRGACFRQAVEFDPISILQVGQEAFCNLRWLASYGGEKWCAIAKGGLLFKKVPYSVFIDHLLDLAHNGGALFDRYIIFQSETRAFREFLDFKRNATTENWKEYYLPSRVYPIVFEKRKPRSVGVSKAPFEIKTKMQRMFIPKFLWYNQPISDLHHYRPVKFGKTIFEGKMIDYDDDDGKDEDGRRIFQNAKIGGIGEGGPCLDKACPICYPKTEGPLKEQINEQTQT